MNDTEIIDRLHNIDLTPAMKDWMERYWGVKCEDFEPGCPCCKAWRIFETTGEQVRAV